jgi:hypothetical protein
MTKIMVRRKIGGDNLSEIKYEERNGIKAWRWSELQPLRSAKEIGPRGRSWLRAERDPGDLERRGEAQGTVFG